MSPTTNNIIGLVMGLISLGLSQFYTFPQLYKLCKTRNTSGISLPSYVIFILTSIFWVIWASGFFYEQTHMYSYETCGPAELFKWSLIPAILLNSLDVIMMSFIITFKIYNLWLCKKYQTVELLLVNQLKQKQFWILLIAIIAVVGFAITLSICLTFLAPLSNDGDSFIWLIVMNILASATWEIFNWPQFIKTIKTKDTTGISLFWAIFILVSCIVTFCYDMFLGFVGSSFNWSILPGLICSGIIPALGFLIIKIRNITKAKKMGMSEQKYTQTYIVGCSKK